MEVDDTVPEKCCTFLADLRICVETPGLNPCVYLPVHGLLRHKLRKLDRVIDML